MFSHKGGLRGLCCSAFHCSILSSSPDDKPEDSESHGEEDPSAQCQPTPPPPHPGDENSNSSHVSAPGVLRRPEEPNLADRSSQSSITSQDDTGTTLPYHPYTQASGGTLLLMHALTHSTFKGLDYQVTLEILFVSLNIASSVLVFGPINHESFIHD